MLSNISSIYAPEVRRRIESKEFGVFFDEDIFEILKQRPEVSLRLLEVVGTRLRLIEERLVEATYSPVRVRMAHFLLTNADLISGVLNNITHEEIGDIIGAARQTVTETLNLLQNQGFISIKPKKIRIVDRPGLEEIVSS